MTRAVASLNYAIGSLWGNLFNIYLHGTAIVSTLFLIFGLIGAGSLNEAVQIVLDVYIMKLVPWPVDELLLAETLAELFFSHAVTVTVGIFSAATRYWLNNPNY